MAEYFLGLDDTWLGWVLVGDLGVTTRRRRRGRLPNQSASAIAVLRQRRESMYSTGRSTMVAIALDEVVRDFRLRRCLGCWEKIPFKTAKYCYLCDPEQGNPTAGGYGPYDDTSPGWDNMIRAMEDRQ